MSDDMRSQAELRLDVVSNLDKAINDLAKFNEQAGFADKATESLERQLAKAREQLDGVSQTARNGSSSLKGYADGFDALLGKLNKFSAAQRRLAQEGAVANPLAGVDRSGIQALPNEQLQQYKTTMDAANFNPQSEIIAEINRRNEAAKEAAQADSDWAEAERRLHAVQLQRAEADAAEANRQQEAGAQVRARAAAERDLAAAQHQAEIGGRNYLNLSTAYDQQFAQRSAASAQFAAQLRAQMQAEQEATQVSTSSAYSLLNISFTLGAVTAGFTAADVAAVKTAANFEASFAQVRRTADLSGDAAEHFKQELIGLSTSTPETFETVAGIAALGGQLNISAASLLNFTKATAEFSATSDVTSDAAGTALGRLGQLLPDVDGQYENLASSVLKVGVNSVATESQIISIATQIAGIGRNANLSTSDVVGLSGAIASVGVQPELARGTVTRLFTQIQTAVSSGGESLDAFAQLSGQSADQFAASWKNAPTTALTSLLKGINSQGSNAAAALESIGLASDRDLPTLQRLAQNTDVLQDALANARSGFADNSELQRQYGIVSETVSAKLQVLSNNWQAFMATVGGSAGGGVSKAIDGLTKLLQIITTIAGNPIGQWISVALLGFAGLVGVVGALATGMALAAGNTLLLRAAFQQGAIGATTMKVATTGLNIALKGLGGVGIILSLAAVAASAASAAGVFDTASDKADKFFGSADQLSAGFEKDAAVYAQTGKAISTITTEQTTAGASASEWSGHVNEASKAQQGLASSVGQTTGAISQQTLVYGENARAALASMLQQSKAYQDLFKSKGLQGNLLAAGGSLQGFTEAILGDPENGADEYIKRMQAALDARSSKLHLNKSAIGSGIDVQAFDQLRSAADAIGGSITSASTAMAAYQATAGGAAAATNDLDGSVQNAAGGSILLRDQVNEQIKSLYGGVNAQYALADSTYSLGEAFYNNGAAAAVNGSELQQVISNIISASGTTGEAAGQLQGFFDALVSGGYASASQLDILRQVIRSLAPEGAKATKFNMKPFVAGMGKARASAQKAASATKKVAQEVKTLADYASDLGGVFDRAFEIRFGGDQVLDKISSGWSEIRKNAADAHDAMAEANATLRDLAADRKIDQYWLKIARMYGDTLRAAKIQADLAKNSKDTADAQKDLDAAQGKASKSLIGNSDAAIENRNSLYGLVGNYQDYIGALATSGMSQAELSAKTQQLRADFIRQATQMGYNRSEVDRFATAFDDMTVAINRVPRKITVKANTNPALQALQEFIDKANASKANVSVGADPGPAGNAGAFAADAYKNGFEAQMQRNPIAIDGYLINGQQVYRVPNTSLKMYDTGGYTGPGGKYATAGIVHKGEWVFNQQATRNIGPENLARLHSAAQYGRPTMGATAGGGGGGGYSGPIDLAPSSIQAIADAVASRPNFFSGPQMAKINAMNNVNSTNRGV